MKTFLVIALAVGCAFSLRAQTDPAADVVPAPAPAPAHADSPADTAWKKISDDSHHISGYLQTHNRAGLELLAPSTLKELKVFVAKYPKDPQSAQARLLAAQLGNLMRELGMPDAPTADKILSELSALAADTTAPMPIRAQAGLVVANRSIEAAERNPTPAAFDDLDQKIETFQKQFGGVAVDEKMSGAMLLRQEEISLLKQVGDDARLDALLAKLVHDADPDVAAMGKKEQDLALSIAGYKTKPMDLTFTAVDGSTVDLAKLRGKVVLLDFWATWCAPCIEETPDVVATYQKYHDQGFEIVGISLDQDEDALKSYTTENKMPWPQYFDGKGFDSPMIQRFGVEGIPAMWLIGKDGKLVSTSARLGLGDKVAGLLGAK